MEKPADYEKEEGYDVTEAVKSVLSNRNRATSKATAPATTTTTPASVLSPHQTAKIQRLRSMYTPTGSQRHPSTGPQTDGGVTMPQIPERKLGTLSVRRAHKISIQDALSLEPLDVTATMGGKQSKQQQQQQRDRYTLGIPGKPTTIAEAAGRGSGLSGDDNDDDLLELLTNDTDAMSLNAFESHQSVHGMAMDVNEATIDRGAVMFSSNDMVVDPARRASPGTVGTARILAVEKKQ